MMSEQELFAAAFATERAAKAAAKKAGSAWTVWFNKVKGRWQLARRLGTI